MKYAGTFEKTYAIGNYKNVDVYFITRLPRRIACGL